MTPAQSDELDYAASAAALGLDPRPILAWRDPVERVLWGELLTRAIQARDTLDENLAIRIAARSLGVSG